MFLPTQLPMLSPMQSGGFNVAPQLAQSLMGNTMNLQQQAMQTAFQPSMLRQRLQQMQTENAYLPMTLGSTAFANAAYPLSQMLNNKLAMALIPGYAQNAMQGLAQWGGSTGVFQQPFVPNAQQFSQTQQKVANYLQGFLHGLTGGSSGATHRTMIDGKPYTWDGSDPSTLTPSAYGQ